MRQIGRMIAASLVGKATGVTPGAYAFLRGMDLSGGPGEQLTEPYRRSVWVQAAIKKISGPVASVAVDFYRAGSSYKEVGKVTPTPLPARCRQHVYRTVRGIVKREDEAAVEIPVMQQFLRSPMRGLTYSDFVEATIGWLKMAGESFWLLPDTATGVFPRNQAVQVIVARPDRMHHLVVDGKLVGWEFFDAGGRRHGLLPDQVIQLRYWNPYDEWRGLSEYDAARIAAEGDYLAGKFNRNLMANNGDTGPYIVAKNGIPTDPQREQILQDLRAKREAQLNGKFRPVFLTGDIAVEDPKIRAVDAAYIAGRIENRHEVCIAFGVPPSMFDVKAAYSIGSASDFYQLILNTCVPCGDKLCDGLMQLARRLTGEELEAFLDWDEHPVLQDVRKERLASVDTLWNKGMPMAEISEYLGLGLPRFEGDDVGYLGISVMPVSEATAEPAPPVNADFAEPSNGNDGNNGSDGSEGSEGSEGNDLNDLDDMVAEMTCAVHGRKDVIETRKKRQRIWEQHMRRRMPVVKAYQVQAAKLFNQYRGKVLARFEEWYRKNPPKTEALESPEDRTRAAIDFIFDASDFGKALKLVLGPVGEHALATAGQQLFDEVGHTKDPWKTPPEKSLEFAASRSGALQGVAATARGQLNTVIENGLQAGKSIEKITEDIRGVFTNLGKFEAKRIAMTETACAFGFARNEAMKRAGVGYKSWLSSRGPNVRPAHEAAESKYFNKPIPADEPFVVGGEELMYPGDPEGSAGNIINCHCVSVAAEKPAETTDEQ